MNTQQKISAILGALIASTMATGVYARGGTAKPPVRSATGPYFVPTAPDPLFSVPATDIHQFDTTGFIQDVTVTDPANPNSGGTIKVNDITITVPSNSIVQMPANTLTWADAVDIITHPPLTLSAPNTYPSFEASIAGNIVGGTHIAGLVFLSQQSLNSGSGVITRIDYADGSIYVGGKDGLGDQVRLQINDPGGRFGRPQSPDDRFSVDDENPTIHAATGYPMCVPRTDPAAADDPLCPQKNRPRVNTTLSHGGCRNFTDAGVSLPVSGELSAPVTGQVYCSQYVMKAVAGTAQNPLFSPTATNQAGLTDPDVRSQAPFEVGDYISFSGTLMHDPLDPTKDYISAHTIEANVGIYTQPGTQPSYLAIGEFGVGTADPNGTAASGVAQETQDRIFLEAETTDVKVPVDIYLVDTNDPVTGAPIPEANRWITMFEMTGECDPSQNLAVSCLGVSGGITTQNNGPQPQRARIRATKSIAGILSQASRNIRVVARSLCKPGTADLSTTTGHSATLDACLGNAASIAATGDPTVTANGLVAGQYLAPVFEYIFPEGTKPGDLVVPNDFWHLPFLRFGEGNGVGPLTPSPW